MRVRIYKPSRNTMQSGQSGRGKTGKWVLEYVTTSARRPESLMGWTSSADTLNQVKMNFDTKEAAIRFADSKGWIYTVADEKIRKIRPRNYGDNFKFCGTKEQA